MQITNLILTPSWLLSVGIYAISEERGGGGERPVQMQQERGSVEVKARTLIIGAVNDCVGGGEMM